MASSYLANAKINTRYSILSLYAERIQPRQFTHKTTEASEGSWDASLWVDLYQGVFLRVNVNLQQAGPVQWTVHQHEQRLRKIKYFRKRLSTRPFVIGIE